MTHSIDKPAHSKQELILLLIFVLNAPVMELLNVPMGTVRNLYIPAIDGRIPFVPELILVYHTYIFLVAGFGYALWKRGDTDLYRRYMLAMIIAQVLAYLTFPIFQTYVPRADELGLFQDNGLFERMVRLTYGVDNHYCGFPSIHVEMLTLCFIAALTSRRIRPLARGLVAAYALLIAASTLLVKQHVFLDVPGGVLYAVVSWYLAIPVRTLYLRLLASWQKRRPPSTEPTDGCAPDEQSVN